MSERIEQNNDVCDWILDLNGNGHSSDLGMKDESLCRVMLYANDDPHYSIAFESRASLEGFVAKLQHAADEVWPR
jgi:hypothetical protein